MLFEPVRTHFDSTDKAALADIDHPRPLPALRQFCLKIANLVGEIFQYALILKNLQIRQRRSAAELIAGIAMPMEKRFILPILAQKGIKNILSRDP